MCPSDYADPSEDRRRRGTSRNAVFNRSGSVLVTWSCPVHVRVRVKGRGEKRGGIGRTRHGFAMPDMGVDRLSGQEVKAPEVTRDGSEDSTPARKKAIERSVLRTQGFTGVREGLLITFGVRAPVELEGAEGTRGFFSRECRIRGA